MTSSTLRRGTLAAVAVLLTSDDGGTTWASLGGGTR
jgi:hypothetical protein